MCTSIQVSAGLCKPPTSCGVRPSSCHTCTSTAFCVEVCILQFVCSSLAGNSRFHKCPESAATSTSYRIDVVLCSYRSAVCSCVLFRSECIHDKQLSVLKLRRYWIQQDQQQCTKGSYQRLPGLQTAAHGAARCSGACGPGLDACSLCYWSALASAVCNGCSKLCSVCQLLPRCPESSPVTACSIWAVSRV